MFTPTLYAEGNLYGSTEEFGLIRSFAREKYGKISTVRLTA
jgi:hypothetical protein